MLIKKEWFRARACGFLPATWEGWVFVSVLLLLLALAVNLPVVGWQRLLFAALVLLFFLMEIIAFLFEKYPDLEDPAKRQQHIVFATVAYSSILSMVLAFLYDLLIDKHFSYSILGALILILATKIAISFYIYRK